MDAGWFLISFALGFATCALIAWGTVDRRRRNAERTLRERLVAIKTDADAKIKAIQAEADVKFDAIEARVLAEAERRLDDAVSSALARFAAQTGFAGPPKTDA